MTDKKRKEILTKAKQILFGTDMVKAILDGRKTTTRRVLKPHNTARAKRSGYYQGNGLWCDKDTTYIKDYSISCCWIETKTYIKEYAPYKVGDILYVRETWRIGKAHHYDADAHIEFKADGKGTVLYFSHGCTDSVDREDYDGFIGKWGVGDKWHPCIHMPKEAARIFLKVTNVRVERLQDMSEEDAYKEGWSKPWCAHKVFENYPDSPIPCEAAGNPSCPIDPPCNHSVPELFGADIWDKTIKKSDLDRYGWDANPWVWVVEFERID